MCRIVTIVLATLLIFLIMWHFSAVLNERAPVSPVPRDPNQPAGLELQVKPVGPAPGPYQAVRLQISLCNRGEVNLKDLCFPEVRCVFDGIKGPDNQEFRPMRMLLSQPASLDLRPYWPGSPTYYANTIAEERISLAPGEIVSVSGPLSGMVWLQHPGEYVFKLRLRQTPELGYDMRALATVIVRQPEEDDAAVAMIFRDNPKLTERCHKQLTFGWPCSSEHVPTLERIVHRHPKSSYADYSRLLLARYYYERRATANAEKARKDREANRGKIPLAKEPAVPEAPPEDKWPVRPSDDPTPEDIAAALAMLEPINVKRFPHGPDVLIFRHQLLKRDDEARAQQVLDTLQQEFPDAIEWLEYQANELHRPFDQIMKNRRTARAQSR